LVVFTDERLSHPPSSLALRNPPQARAANPHDAVRNNKLVGVPRPPQARARRNFPYNTLTSIIAALVGGRTVDLCSSRMVPLQRSFLFLRSNLQGRVRTLKSPHCREEGIAGLVLLCHNADGYSQQFNDVKHVGPALLRWLVQFLADMQNIHF